MTKTVFPALLRNWQCRSWNVNARGEDQDWWSRFGRHFWVSQCKSFCYPRGWELFPWQLPYDSQSCAMYIRCTVSEIATQHNWYTSLSDPSCPARDCCQTVIKRTFFVASVSICPRPYVIPCPSRFFLFRKDDYPLTPNMIPLTHIEVRKQKKTRLNSPAGIYIDINMHTF